MKRKSTKIKSKIIFLNLSSVLIVMALFIGIVLFQKNKATAKVDIELNNQIDTYIAAISKDIYNQVETLHGILQTEVVNCLNVARSIMNQKGPVTLDSSMPVQWEAINQFTKTKTELRLPQMKVGGQWLGRNASMDTPSPIVDDVLKLVGGTTTIFQKMNERGDMLRVCTNVKKPDGSRAIGTYIPVANPDGSVNEVVSAVLAGKTYKGKAYVVNAWYLAVYEPIYNEAKEVIGILYFGIRQEKSKVLREGIMKTVVGKTGYIYVLGAKGNSRGNYIISKDGKRDGESIFDAKDSDGNFFIRSVVSKALKLKPGQVGYERYPWLNKGEAEPRWKKVAITYFEPWDWVIGASLYEEDF
ncbi:MAG: methyl-accepting chemotaxis protein, partial [bacterium]|nr:methyl-accepting chemotaxis protein [bacterium]